MKEIHTSLEPMRSRAPTRTCMWSFWCLRTIYVAHQHISSNVPHTLHRVSEGLGITYAQTAQPPRALQLQNLATERSTSAVSTYCVFELRWSFVSAQAVGPGRPVDDDDDECGGGALATHDDAQEPLGCCTDNAAPGAIDEQELPLGREFH